MKVWILNVLVSDHPQKDEDIGYFSTEESAKAEVAKLPSQCYILRSVDVDAPVAEKWKR